MLQYTNKLQKTRKIEIIDHNKGKKCVTENNFKSQCTIQTHSIKTRQDKDCKTSNFGRTLELKSYAVIVG